MSKIKSIIYGILSVMGFAIMCWSMIPVGAGMINLGMVLVACFGLFVLGYTLLSLKYPKEEVPFKKDQDADYKVKMEIARLKAEQVDTSKLRGTVLFGMRNVDLDAFDEKMEALNVPGMVVSRETREKIEIISNKTTSVFLDIFIISHHHFIILYLRCQINVCFIIGLNIKKP